MRALLLLVAVGLLVPVAFAQAPPNLASGKKLFKANCGPCHHLSVAGTHGHVGPNLDGDNLKYTTVTFMVNGGDSLMPGLSDRFTRTQLRDLASYVVSATAVR